MADNARELHGGVHGLASRLISVTGGAIVIGVNAARVFNGPIVDT